MQKLFKKIFCIQCVILMIFMLCMNVYAAGEGLQINYKFDGVSFDLYQVATYQQDGTLTITKTFEEYKVNLNTSEYRDIAITLSGYVARDNIKSDMNAVTNQKKCSFQNLDSGLYLLLGSSLTTGGYTYTPIPVLFEINGFSMSIEVKSDQTPEYVPELISCSVEKIWCGTTDYPNSVAVQLLRDGEIFDEVLLNDKNDWSYVWSRLDASHMWQVIEKEVPDGYVVSVIQSGFSFKIINTIDTPVPPPSTDDTMISVHKVWDDNNIPDRPDSILVQLLRDGKLYNEIELNASNQWTYTWDGLDADSNWSVVEVEVPTGYTATYSTFGNIVYITNTKDSAPPTPSSPVDLTVRKVWEGDDDTLADRPDSVGITLYNGSTAIETIWLGEWNNWSYSWENLDANGNWSVLETNVPNGYTPSYSVHGNVVTVTNTSTLIQTGQLIWPIPVLGSLGVMMISFGIIFLLKKKKKNDV